MELNETTLTDHLDARVHEIVKQHFAQNHNEADTRWKIIAVLAESGIPAYVSRTVGLSDSQTRDDLAGKLQELIEEKARQTTPGGLELERILTGSVCGWARQLAKRGAQTKLRDLYRKSNRNLDVDPTSNENDNMKEQSHEQTTFHLASVEFDATLSDNDLVNEIESIQDEYEGAALGTRTTGLGKIRSDSLLRAFKLPNLIRPTAHLDREFVLMTINSDPNAAKFSISAMYALAMNSQTPEQRRVDERLLSVWDDFSGKELSLLMSKPARVAHQLMLTAVSPALRPPRETILNTQQAMQMADDSPRWKQTAAELLESWLAVEVEAFSINSPAASKRKTPETPGEIEKDTPEAAEIRAVQTALDRPILAKRTAAGLEWADRVAAVAAMPSSPLGTTEADVTEWISLSISTP